MAEVLSAAAGHTLSLRETDTLTVCSYVCSVCACLDCRFPLPLGVWEGLRFVIVTLPGLFSYLCLSNRFTSLLKRSLL